MFIEKLNSPSTRKGNNKINSDVNMFIIADSRSHCCTEN